MNLFISPRKTSPPQNCQLVVDHYQLKCEVDGFAGRLTFSNQSINTLCQIELDGQAGGGGHRGLPPLQLCNPNPAPSRATPDLHAPALLSVARGCKGVPTAANLEGRKWSSVTRTIRRIPCANSPLFQNVHALSKCTRFFKMYTPIALAMKHVYSRHYRTGRAAASPEQTARHFTCTAEYTAQIMYVYSVYKYKAHTLHTYTAHMPHPPSKQPIISKRTRLLHSQL